MSKAGVALVDAHGAAMSLQLLPQLEEGSSGAVADLDEATCDLVREGAVVMLGTLAKHLMPEDPKVSGCTPRWHCFSTQPSPL